MIAENASIHLLRPVDELDYYDTRSISLPDTIKPLQAWNLIMGNAPSWLRHAFHIRDVISARFGVKRIGGFSGTQRHQVCKGDYLDFFLVEHVSDDALVLTARDSHLDVMTCISTQGKQLTITSSVVTHNAFGKAYMLPVGTAHKLIVHNMLRSVRKSLTFAVADTTGME